MTYATEAERLAAKRAAQARWRSKNRQAANAATRAWKDRNREKVAADHRAWRAANPERSRELVREAYARWREANPESYLAGRRQGNSRRRARILGSDPDLTEEQWQEIVQEFGGLCAYCGSDQPIELEHVVPLARGGRHTASNVVPACRSCNASKGSKLLADWLGFV